MPGLGPTSRLPPAAEQAQLQLPQSLRGDRRAGSAAGLLLLRLAARGALPWPPLRLLRPRLLPRQPAAQGHQGEAAAGAQGGCGGAGPDSAPSPQAVVPVTSICALKKTNTALLVPNALSIRTAEGDKVSAGGGRSGGPEADPGHDRLSPCPQFLFVSLRQREATFQLLKSLCKHLQVCAAPGGGPGSVPPGALLHLSLSRTTAGGPWPLPSTAAPRKSLRSLW